MCILLWDGFGMQPWIYISSLLWLKEAYLSIFAAFSSLPVNALCGRGFIFILLWNLWLYTTCISVHLDIAVEHFPLLVLGGVNINGTTASTLHNSSLSNHSSKTINVYIYQNQKSSQCQHFNQFTECCIANLSSSPSGLQFSSVQFGSEKYMQRLTSKEAK